VSGKGVKVYQKTKRIRNTRSKLKDKLAILCSGELISDIYIEG